MTNSVLPWSWSSYNDYQTCPYRFYKTRITKEFVEPPSEHLIWGDTVHKSIENYATGQAPMVETTLRFKPIIDKYLALPGNTLVEQELAATNNHKPTGFWDENAWVRGKADLIKINENKAAVIDWKTGKVKPSLQLDLMGALLMIKVPEVEKVTSIFCWLQDPQRPTVKTFDRSQLDTVMGQFSEGVRNMLWSEIHNTWPQKPSGLCRAWCPVKDCPHYGRGRSWR